MPNNGNITVLPRPAVTRAEPEWEEIMFNGVRYQVPEETLVLDFWAKVRGKNPKYVKNLYEAVKAHSAMHLDPRQRFLPT